MRISYICIWVFLIIFITQEAEARHNSRVSTGSLDDEPVEIFPVPVLFGVDPEVLVADFGDPRGDGTRTHEGQDMRALKGTPVVSPTEAVVVNTGTGPSAGKYVYTANPGGEVFRYMHLDYIADLDRGDKLKAGDFIGTVGDTGNAPDGVYHLHFEIRKNNKPTDPLPRMEDSFTLKEKISFLDKILDDVDDKKEYVEFLVENFADELTLAVRDELDLPRTLKEALEASGVYSRQSAVQKLEALIDSIPSLLTMELKNGDQGSTVTLLQLYLIYGTEGSARDQLAAAGATGYFGPITANALSSLQLEVGALATGVYDQATRAAL